LLRPAFGWNCRTEYKSCARDRSTTKETASRHESEDIVELYVFVHVVTSYYDVAPPRSKVSPRRGQRLGNLRTIQILFPRLKGHPGTRHKQPMHSSTATHSRSLRHLFCFAARRGAYGGQHPGHEHQQFFQRGEMCGLARDHMFHTPGDLPLRDVG